MGYYGATYGYVIAVCFPKRKWHLYNIAQIVKRYDENIHVATGGVSATTRDLEILRKSVVDFVIRGESETPLLTLSNALIQNEDFEKIRGISFMKDDRIVQTDNQSFIDLDTLDLLRNNLTEL